MPNRTDNPSHPNDPRLEAYGPVATPVERGTPVTDSERYLAKVAEQTFLNLWCYPNTFIDKKSNQGGDGKELCDLLVVCGDHVLIFSDKTIAWPGGNDPILAWSRWYKRAVKKSVDQIRGAERWIRSYPERIFLDRQCRVRLPIVLPHPDRMTVHGIVVAGGCAGACRAFFEEGSGSLMLIPSVQGPAHSLGDNVRPFVIGDVDPEGPFVHVLDETSLDVVLSELDTISDLTEYLTKKAAFIRPVDSFQRLAKKNSSRNS